MAKSREQEVDDINLVPIMNLVLILIPLLLLSIVFMQIAVINVTMPAPSVGKPADPSDEPPKRLRLIVNREGFTLFKGDTKLPSTDGACSVTICHAKAEDPMLLHRYNWMELYNKLLQIKQEAAWSEHNQLEIVAGSDITYDILIKAMDVSRHKLTNETETLDAAAKAFTSQDDFKSARVIREQTVDEESGKEGLAPSKLFPLVVLGMPATN